MTIVRTGSNRKFATGWEQAFGKKSGGKKKPAASKKKAAAKKSK
jgi:hypothetical protein